MKKKNIPRTTTNMMTKNNSPLDQEPLYGQVQALLAEGKKNTEIARTIGKSETAIRRFKRRHRLTKRLVEKTDNIRVLCLDIETKPAVAYVWGLFDQNIGLDQLISPSEIICWAAKWLGQSEVEFRSSYHDGKDQMIKRIWELLDEADVVIHYNGQRFDVPHLNRELIEHDFGPPAPYQQIDLLKTARKHFRFQSNKMAHVSVKLGLEGKVKHEGFTLWVECMNNDPEAWERMREYNIQDTQLLEPLYKKLLPWIPGHPSHAAYHGKNVCPKCGGSHIQYRGNTITRTAKYKRIHCLDCGSWSRDTKRFEGVQITEASL